MKRFLGTTLKVAVAAVLFAWILNTIFLQESRAMAQFRRHDWNALGRMEQYRIAWQEGPPALWHTLTSVNPRWLGASVVCMGMTIFLGALRWRAVLRAQGLDLSPGRTLGISLVAQFFNSFLLGSAGGDVIKAYYAARETHHQKPEAVAAVLADRVIGLWSMLLFACAMMPMNATLIGQHRRLLGFSAITLGGLLVGSVFMLAAFRGGVSRRWTGAYDWLRRLPKADGIVRALKSLRELGGNHAVLGQALGLSLCVSLFGVLQVASLSHALGLRVDLTELLLIVPVVYFMSALGPLGGLGVREGLFVWLLAVPPMSVPETGALSLSLLAFAGFLFWSLVGGVVYLVFRSRHQMPDVRAGAA